MRMRTATILGLAWLVVAAATPAAGAKRAPRGRVLVACIENDNRSAVLDKLFEGLGALLLERFARRYDRAAILRDCSKRDLIAALGRFRSHRTDVAMLAHGSRWGIRLNRSFLSRREIAGLGRYNPNLRAVFQLNCWGSALNRAWLRAGARAVTGARRINVAFLAFENFFRAWTAGHSFRAAVATANRPRGPLQALLAAVGALARGASPAVDSTFVMRGNGALRF